MPGTYFDLFGGLLGGIWAVVGRYLRGIWMYLADIWGYLGHICGDCAEKEWTEEVCL